MVRPPRALRQRSVHLDNVTLLPASLLPFKEQWRQIANGLPAGSVLVCMPTKALRQRWVVERVVAHLRQQGKRVAVVDKELQQSAL